MSSVTGNPAAVVDADEHAARPLENTAVVMQCGERLMQLYLQLKTYPEVPAMLWL